ncbi:REP element-mobilizing transposase RayT [Filimonas lacunae]|uniref:REP element-mobilizing transposase RayT n=1 Tax=Filimonas lacunae TaxID=477680 RepID=A0A173MLX3_9BACT|nr:transposase [Filimonas lacunae]BAV08469.1 transposase [Filimonas lacunae]SIT33989.1 REP element-mobilizing transposase RayT [Filimonas lacunae]
MTGTKSFIYVHALWAVKDNQPLLSLPVRKVLFVHTQQEANAKGIQLVTINGVADHIHCLFKMMPVQNLSGIIKQLKEMTAFWLNENKLLLQPFEWNEHYAAYSVSPTTIDKASDYILKQEQFHAGKTLEQELEAFDKMNAHL